MGSGGPSTTSQSTVNRLPKWALPFAKDLLGSYAGMIFPGSNFAGQLPVAQMPADLNQQVAGFTPDQLAAMKGIEGQTAGSTTLAEAGATNLEDTLAGKYLDPSTNPWLKKTFDQAASGVTNDYQLSIAPSLQAEAQQAGVAGGSAANEQQQFNQFSLGQNLNNLATNIYGGNYTQERQRQLEALGMIPTEQQALYQPQQELLGVGALQQGQQQNVLDTAYKNALARTQYPFQLLQGLGGILGQAIGGTGTSITTGTNPGATK